MPRILFALTPVLGCIVVAGLYWSFGERNESRGAVLVEPPSRVVEVNHGEGPVLTDFRVHNATGEVLNLGAPVSSCGCTVADMDLRVLNPGQSATIRLEGRPRDFGIANVSVKIPTSNKAYSPVVLNLTMKTIRNPPFLIQHSGPLNFGAINESNMEINLKIDTCEHASSEAWLRHAATDLDGATIAEGPPVSVNQEDGSVTRTYEYRIKLGKRPPIGLVKGEVAFFAEVDPGSFKPVITLPITGEVRGPISATPSHIYITSGSAAGAEGAEVVVRFSPATKERPALSLSSQSSDKFDVSIEPISALAYKLSVRPRGPVQSSFASDITLDTGIDEVETFSIPVFVKAD